MLLIGFPALAFGTNCYLVAPSEGEECLVIDPGFGVVDQLEEVLSEHRLKPAAVLATHGHLDHIFSVTPVCGAHGVALSVHAADRYRLADPTSTLGPQLKVMFEQHFGASGWKEPDDVVELTDRQTLSIASIVLDVIHAPGHTEGSVMFTLPDVPSGLAPDLGLTSTLVSGDVLFAGSIGRTDLPGGSAPAMNRSLRERVLPLPEDMLVLPGHGEVTTMGQERATNPYLQKRWLESP
jgi:glyoxylase-like metal-dependent hydrolase (beta-lactamase superfamily II)